MMKKQFLFYALILTVIIQSCKKNFGFYAEPVSGIKFTLQLKEQLPHIPLEKAILKMTNLRNGLVVELKANNKGEIILNEIIPGEYDFEANLHIGAEEYSQIIGEDVDIDVDFNASLKKQSITHQSSSYNLSLVRGVAGSWIIKQIYYGGSHRQDGANFRDQFIEFYNNTDSVLYADSLYFAQIFGENSSTSDLSKGWFQPNGQLDWTKAPLMNNPNANTDFVYAYHIFRFPGTGKQYPVQPGTSIVLAQNAINHKAPYIGNDGLVQTVINPELTVDLSNADFEGYLVDYNRDVRGKTSPYRWDIDNPNVPNIEVLLTTHNDLILDSKGRDAYVIFNAPAHVVNDWMTNRSYQSPEITQSAEKDRFIQIPIIYAIDAVELQPTLVADRIPKRLMDELDAGFVYLPAGYYVSQTAIRKTDKTVNGRRILKDSNNSSNDFGWASRPRPKGFID